MKRDAVKTVALWAIIISFGMLIIWLFGKYLFMGILPFVVAYPLSLLIKPMATLFAKRAHLKRNFCCVLLIVIFISFSALIVSWLVSTVISQSSGLVSSLVEALDKEDNFIKTVFDYFANLKERIPLLNKLNGSERGDVLYNAIMNTVESGLSQITSVLASGVSDFISKLPKFVFALITTVIALFYFTMDKGGLKKEVYSLLGDKTAERLATIKSRAVKAFSNYMKSYAIIMLITFGELFLGFVILRVEYAMLLAFFIAAIDILPILGAGIVLVPWGALCLLTGNTRLGVGLFILCGIMYVIRQIIEPHILGSVMGVHPVISLFSVYLGFVLFGVGGIIILPFLTYILKAVFYDEYTVRR